MLPGQSFQNASATVVSRFANKGVLLEPVTNDYDPLTGKTAYSYAPYTFEFVTVTNKSLPKDSALKVASLRQTLIWFTFPQKVIDRSWGVLTVDAVEAPGTRAEIPETPWTDRAENIWYDEVAEAWVIPFESSYTPQDIVDLEKVVVNDIIVGYYALLEYKED